MAAVALELLEALTENRLAVPAQPDTCESVDRSGK